MRVAALAFGVLAGLVASLILALGGLDVVSTLGAADRQAQAIRFALFLIGNLGVFGAALTLAAPFAGAIFLVVGALAWVGAALLMHHTADLVLIVPPALLLIGAILALIAHFRGPRPARAELDDEDPDVEVIPPDLEERAARPSDMMDGDDDVGIPAFAAEQKPAASVRGAFNDDREAALSEDWNPRRKPTPPPRTKPAFRPVEDEYEDDEEPSGLSRFAQGLSSVLSFGLYAALVGAGVLIFWSMRNDTVAPAATLAEAPALSSKAEVAALPPPSQQARLPSAEATLEPILTGEPLRNIETSGAAPSTSPSELVAATTTQSQETNSFGSVTMSADGVPMLSDDFGSSEQSPALASPEASEEMPAEPEASPEEQTEPEAATLELPQPEPTTAASPDQPMPRSMPPQMAAERTAPGTGPTRVAAPRTNLDNTGL